MSEFTGQELAAGQCVPCRGGIPPMTPAEIAEVYPKLGPDGNGWQVIADHHLQKIYTFHDYQSGVDFTNKVAALAERVDHHPSILLEWGRVTVTIWTHKIDGLTHSDFVFAAKADQE